MSKKAKSDTTTAGHAGAVCLEIADVCKVILGCCSLEAAARLSSVVLSNVGTRAVAEDVDVWASLVTASFGYRRHFPAASPCPIGSVPVPAPGFVPSSACIEFCETAVEWGILQRARIVQGNIETITDVNGQPVDCLVFPTNASLQNAGTGAAAAVFRRAGPALDAHVASLRMNARESTAVVTPGFAAGVEHLVHCVGPSHHRFDCNPLLYHTYLNAFEHCRRLGVSCIAVASISTGTLGFPLQTATTLALRAYRDFVKTHRWRATIAFVCFDAQVAAGLQAAKNELLGRFNAHAFQVMAVV
ncbi:hypothetical protein SPRG_07210 [Saprolegnia parasitica CBS 223.65]|uniref:Macro domain-containing protein n=1 Tax=Saprolegnia parasitica (strain CBS 223.65) TaxID=695850 RepID=A0A067CFH3_SAPPC|nr:hypothetical protein SPRG_07210 [Saprolegnia parasitica CBS 223.65]KDO27935.1 hypothetical protein SPRG_07210 [Saprolegnia parasitica CBS 223.65]|eukprot:XP_012201390.1 hypothetical protein SPRG_07210 [Saprolegnia parasitica CBS 223.65]